VWLLVTIDKYYYSTYATYFEEGKFAYQFSSRIIVLKGWTIVVLGFDSRRELRIFLITTSRTALGSTQPPIQCVPGALSLEGKGAGA
jgi:hypothetical protein